MYKNALKDALYNLSPQSSKDTKGYLYHKTHSDYTRGLVIGIMAALALRMSYKTACKKIKDALPHDYIPELLPEVYREDIINA